MDKNKKLAQTDPMLNQQTLVKEINQDLLDSYYEFKKNAPLKNYLQNKGPANKWREYFTLREVRWETALLYCIMLIINTEKALCRLCIVSLTCYRTLSYKNG